MQGVIVVRIFVYKDTAEVCPMSLSVASEMYSHFPGPVEGVLLLDSDNATIFDSEEKAKKAAKRTIEFGLKHKFPAWPKSMKEFGFAKFKRGT